MRLLTEVWMGRASFPGALRSGDIELHGDRKQQRDFRKWFTLSGFA